jgi:hypothetical protein
MQSTTDSVMPGDAREELVAGKAADPMTADVPVRDRVCIAFDDLALSL